MTWAECRLASTDEAEDIAGLHLVCLPDTRFGSLSAESGARLYELLLSSNTHFCLAARNSEGLLLGGLLCGASNVQQPLGLYRSLEIVRLAAGGFVRTPRTWITDTWVNSWATRQLKTDLVIEALFVGPDHRQRGVATSLIEALLNRADPSGLSIGVHTRASNTAARSFYRKSGFQPINTRFDTAVYVREARPA